MLVTALVADLGGIFLLGVEYPEVLFSRDLYLVTDLDLTCEVCIVYVDRAGCIDQDSARRLLAVGVGDPCDNALNDEELARLGSSCLGNGGSGVLGLVERGGVVNVADKARVLDLFCAFIILKDTVKSYGVTLSRGLFALGE